MAEFQIEDAFARYAGQRLDVFLAEVSEKTRSAVQKLIEEGFVTVNGKPVSKKEKLKEGDTVFFSEPPPKELLVSGENIPVEIVYEDGDLLVVNKPKGMVVHPAPGNETGTLVNALLYHCAGKLSSINGVIRPGIVHRIDKDTSGLLLVAKTDFAHQSLSAQIQEHSCGRVYHTVVYGRLRDASGEVKAPIGRHKTDRKKMAVVVNGKAAVTHYQVLEEFSGFSYLECRLETGRTHQIRVHMAYLGHPVAGDLVYGPKKGITALNGQCLHAKEIAFFHPRTGERMTFSSPLPPYFSDFLQTLRRKEGRE